MSDRARRRRRRVFLSYLVFTVAVFLGFRHLGPAVITIRSDALAPVLQNGDTVLARRNTKTLERGSTVLVRAPLQTGSRFGDLVRGLRARRAGDEFASSVGRPVVRIVVGLPGEQVQWDHRIISAGTASFDLVFLHPDLPSPESVLQLGPDEYFLLSVQPGRADSRVVGPIAASEILFRVQSIIFPAYRRGVIEPFE